MVDAPADIVEELEGAERSWAELEAGRRRASNRRIRAVVDAKDRGLSNLEIARIMQSVHDELGDGRTVRRGDVPHFVACGYPLDD